MENFIVYFCVYLFTILFAQKYEKTHRKGFLILSFLLIFVFSAIRFDVGPDYKQYVIANKSLEYSGVGINDYFLFNTLGLLFRTIDRSYILVLAVYSILTYFLFYRFLVIKNVLSLGLFVFLFMGFYFDSLDRVRQYLAIGIFLNSIILLKQGKNLKFSLIIIISSLFVHSSLIFTFLSFFLKKKNLYSKGMLLFIVALSITSFIGINDAVWNIISRVIPIYKHYLDTDYIAASGFSSGFGFLFNIIVSLIALRFFKSDILYKNLLVVGLIVYVLAGGNLLISRMSAYFMIVMIYILPVSLKNIKTPSLRNILILLIILFFSKDVNRNKFHYKTIFSTDFLIEKFED